mmetsp:Transcript_4597/g.8727  ORF Transcript_4597/g.8727 Transcript_4597/m.8727 type:complete len:105 (+) Transcript_4597:120-434(+)
MSRTKGKGSMDNLSKFNLSPIQGIVEVFSEELQGIPDAIIPLVQPREDFEQPGPSNSTDPDETSASSKGKGRTPGTPSTKKGKDHTLRHPKGQKSQDAWNVDAA